MNIAQAWSIIKTALYPDIERCNLCADGGCCYPDDCECSCHITESKLFDKVPQATFIIEGALSHSLSRYEYDKNGEPLWEIERTRDEL